MLSQICEDRVIISIHALREEGDVPDGGVSLNVSLFLSTPSARRATRRGFPPVTYRAISIHALREEGDFDNDVDKFIASFDFYPRPPRGGRQITLCHFVFAFGISIHALREEGDSNRTSEAASKTLPFLSTPSARRATKTEE